MSVKVCAAFGGASQSAASAFGVRLPTANLDLRADQISEAEHVFDFGGEAAITGKQHGEAAKRSGEAAARRRRCGREASRASGTPKRSRRRATCLRAEPNVRRLSARSAGG